MGKKPILLIILRFLAFSSLGFFILFGASACNPMHGDASIIESPLCSTAAEARTQISILLPDEATKVRFASYHEWVAAEVYLRFEAPVEVCLKHAAEMLPKQTLSNSINPRMSRLTPFPKSPQFKDLSWYDLGAAKNVVSATERHISVFVDLDRGVFYYHYTD